MLPKRFVRPSTRIAGVFDLFVNDIRLAPPSVADAALSVHGSILARERDRVVGRGYSDELLHRQ
jgi:hypothetical protein